MQRLNEARDDLAARVSQIGMTEMLVAGGLAALASELSRRAEQRRQLAKTQLPDGFFQLPGPFYLPTRDRFDPSGKGTKASWSAVN